MKRALAGWRRLRWRAPDPELTFRQWWWLPIAWALIGGLFSLQPLLWGGLPWADTMRFEALRWWPWLLVAPMVIWFSLRLPLVGSHWLRALLVHVTISLVVTLGIGGLMQLPAFHGPRARRPGPWRFVTRNGVELTLTRPQPADGEGTNTGPGDRMVPSERGRPGWPMEPPFLALLSMRLRLTLPLYWSLVGAAHLLLFQVKMRRSARMEVQLAEARLTTLQMQLQPHFLFNSLNAISSLVRNQPEVADEMICMLASLLRAALETQKRKEISLDEELKLARQYLRIQRVRFGALLNVTEQIDEATREAAVPPLLLQPLLENAVTHGLGNQAGTIALRACVQAGQLHLTITDRSANPDERPADPKPGRGIGLSNTRARLEALYGERASLTLRDDQAGRTAEVRLPLQTIGHHADIKSCS